MPFNISHLQVAQGHSKGLPGNGQETHRGRRVPGVTGALGVPGMAKFVSLYHPTFNCVAVINEITTDPSCLLEFQIGPPLLIFEKMQEKRNMCGNHLLAYPAACCFY